MRRHAFFLLAAQLCAARQPGFSIHQDLLSHPQYEVIFSDSYISESDALALLETKESDAHATYDADVSQTDLSSRIRASAAADAHAFGNDVDSDSPQVAETYELMSMPSSRYLCSLPVLAPPPVRNESETELAKAEEARELTRASTEGWRLMNSLDGTCLYYVFGWWSYSFCYGRDIVQFHAIPGKPGDAPIRDPASHEYVLGRVTAGEQSQSNARPPAHHEPAVTEPTGIAPPNTNLQVKGDQRYLVQRLDSGTVCDLTGRDRTIEIQYHCHPGISQDRIGWIKEITTCTYLMEVQTPRLCADVAFLPPKETRAHPISCRQIISTTDELETWRQLKRDEAAELLGILDSQKHGSKGKSQENLFQGMNIGGVIVGGRQVLGSGEDGQPAAKLAVPRHLSGGKLASKPVVKVLASAKGKAEDGKNTPVFDEEILAEMGITAETLENLWEQMQLEAGDNGWKLEVVEAPGQDPFVRGIIDEGDDVAANRQQTKGGKAAKGAEGGKDAKRTEKSRSKDKDKKKGQGSDQAKDYVKGTKSNTKAKGRPKDDDEDDEGSEEKYFKDEL